jgi:hypothetical protein
MCGSSPSSWCQWKTACLRAERHHPAQLLAAALFPRSKKSANASSSPLPVMEPYLIASPSWHGKTSNPPSLADRLLHGRLASCHPRSIKDDETPPRSSLQLAPIPFSPLRAQTSCPRGTSTVATLLYCWPMSAPPLPVVATGKAPQCLLPLFPNSHWGFTHRSGRKTELRRAPCSCRLLVHGGLVNSTAIYPPEWPQDRTPMSTLLTPATGPWWTSELHCAPCPWVYEPDAHIFQ